MDKNEKLFYDRLIYLEKSMILDRLEISRKNTLLQIDLLKSLILENKYIVGDESVSPEDASKIEAMSPTFAYERDHLNESRRNTYLMKIAIDEERLAKYKEHLKDLDEQIKKSKSKIESYERGIDPGKKEDIKLNPDDDKEDINLDDETNSEPSSDNKKDNDKSDIFLDEPLQDEVVNQTEPPAKFWKRFGYGMLAAAAALAAILGVSKLANNSNAQPAVIEESDQEQKTPNANKTTPTPTPTPKPTPQTDDESWKIPVEPFDSGIVMPSPRPVKPYVPKNVEPTPAPTPTPKPTPTPDQTSFTPAYLSPGESIMNMDNGREVTADGSAYVHKNGETTRGESSELGRTNNGLSIVNEQDLNVNSNNPVSVPRTGDEVTYEEYIDSASPEEAGRLNEAIADFDWDNLFDAEEARLTLN